MRPGRGSEAGEWTRRPATRDRELRRGEGGAASPVTEQREAMKA